ncbi:MAG: nuclear transport factor 2 family protein [Sphingobium sp.]
MVVQTNELDKRVRNGIVAWEHIDAECADVVEDILATLVPEEPYAYTVSPHAVSTDDGAPPPRTGSIPQQVLLTTMAGIRSSYENLRRFTAVQGMDAIAEIRSDWYAFMYGIGEGLVKPTGEIVYSPTAVLFPTMGKQGITGELFWTRTSTGDPYTGGNTGPLAAETATLALHKKLVEALRSADAAAVAAMFHPDSQTGVRDYINETGTLIGLHDREELEAYLRLFFDRFTILDISVVERLATDWCVFAELRWIVEDSKAGGQKFTFFTAEHGEVRPDGLFASRIGHGTDLQPV